MADARLLSNHASADSDRMGQVAVRAAVLLVCVLAVGCSGDSPTSPGTPVGGGTGGTGGAGGTGGGPAPTGQTSIITDEVFDDNGWDEELQLFGAGGTGGGGHVRYLGQVGRDYRRVTITVNSAANSGTAAQVAVFAIKRGTQYFPSTDGTIFTIDYSEDSILLTGEGNGQYSAPALKQNGKLYTLVPGAGAFPTPDLAWTPHSLTGLRQNDFRTLASASEHPDFSAAGGRIDLGFMRLSSVPAGSAGGTQQGGIDNFRMTLNR